MQLILTMDEITEALAPYVASKHNMRLHTVHIKPIDGTFKGDRYTTHIAELHGVAKSPQTPEKDLRALFCELKETLTGESSSFVGKTVDAVLDVDDPTLAFEMAVVLTAAPESHLSREWRLKLAAAVEKVRDRNEQSNEQKLPTQT